MRKTTDQYCRLGHDTGTDNNRSWCFPILFLSFEISNTFFSSMFKNKIFIVTLRDIKWCHYKKNTKISVTKYYFGNV